MRQADEADEGAVTAEFAVVLPAVAAVAILLLGLSRATIVSLDCHDAASAIAREMAVGASGGGGDGDGTAAAGADYQTIARDIAGANASANVTQNGDRVTVIVTCPVVPDPLGILPTRITATATGVIP
ncbi:pilus assembly protein [Bifidobacterium samirii]|uniref:Pilus biosynthesis protein TadE n=1 Tax=Bifidobacterium samirii TaxID=2306974 RepID=A0A430FP50_9BIFI|nr:pilus assembly protein [Bifidobacterium samirii]RSX54607.1 pilus biosynthesis protein TadE [Bifidobacterium samirii]